MSSAMAATPTTLSQELNQLTPSQRTEADRLLATRARAQRLAAKQGLDASDVYHQLLHLARTPSERLKMGLAHDRLSSVSAHRK